MIPLPPDDPVLDGMTTALSAPTMAGILERALLAPTRGALGVESCRPCYVRYKPGTSCLVQYDLTLRDHGLGSTIQIPVHVWLRGDNRAAQLWTGRSLHRLVERAARHQPQPPIARAAFLPDLRAIVQVYPVDLKLRGLVRATSPGKVRRVLDEVLPELDQSPQGCHIQVVRYKPARKALLRYGVPTTVGTNDVYAKVSLESEAANHYHGANQFAVTLQRNGVGAAQPITFVPAFNATLYPSISGVSLRAMRGRAAYLAHLPAVLGVLDGLRADSLALRHHRLADEVAGLRAAAGTISALLPSLRRELDELLGGLERRFGWFEDEVCPAHGDFYDDQLMIGPDGISVIDFDEVRLAHPALDPGNFLAHLHAEASRIGCGVPLNRAIEDLTTAWADRNGRDTLAVATAAGVLRLAVEPFRRLETHWPDRARELVGRARELLPHGASSPINSDRRYPEDPHLPGLAVALNRATIAGYLRSSARPLGAPFDSVTPRLGEPIIVKHKRGRRAVVRYPVAGLNGEDGSVYAKVFAGDRAARVAARTEAVRAAMVNGLVVPRVLCLDEDHRLVLLEGIAGRPLDLLVREGDADAAFRAGVALALLHSSRAALDARHTMEDELHATTRQLAILPTLAADLGEAAQKAFVIVENALRWLEAWRFQPAHRDCHPAQILVT